jgi:hypothetical protein
MPCRTALARSVGAMCADSAGMWRPEAIRRLVEIGLRTKVK